jgi:hypothetical protein
MKGAWATTSATDALVDVDGDPAVVLDGLDVGAGSAHKTGAAGFRHVHHLDHDIMKERKKERKENKVESKKKK